MQDEELQEGCYSLVSLLVGLGGVLEVASVLNGDLIALLGHRTATLSENSLGDTHGCCCDGEVSCC